MNGITYIHGITQQGSLIYPGDLGKSFLRWPLKDLAQSEHSSSSSSMINGNENSSQLYRVIMLDAILIPLNRLKHLNYSFRRSGKIYPWTLSLCSFHSHLKVKLSSKFIIFSQKEARGAYTHLIPKGSMPFGWRYYSAHVRVERSGLPDLACICTNGRAFPKAEPASFTDSPPPSHYEVGSCVGCNDKSWAWVSLILHAVLPLRPLIPIDVSRSSVHRMCHSESRDIDHPSAHIAMTPTASNLF